MVKYLSPTHAYKEIATGWVYEVLVGENATAAANHTFFPLSLLTAWKVLVPLLLLFFRQVRVPYSGYTTSLVPYAGSMA